MSRGRSPGRPLIVFGAILWPSSRWVLVVLGAVSIVPAWLSTVYLEDPIRRDRAIKGRRVVALAVVCTLIPVLASVGLGAGARASWGSDAIAGMKSQISAEHIADRNGCLREQTPIDVPVGICNWSADATGPPVYLVGDSSASQYGEALIGATTAYGSPLTAYARAGCVYADVDLVFDGIKYAPGCRDWVRSTTNWLTGQRQGIVVLASR